jgi:hypothetical protein
LKYVLDFGRVKRKRLLTIKYTKGHEKTAILPYVPGG